MFVTYLNYYVIQSAVDIVFQHQLLVSVWYVSKHVLINLLIVIYVRNIPCL